MDWPTIILAVGGAIATILTTVGGAARFVWTRVEARLDREAGECRKQLAEVRGRLTSLEMFQSGGIIWWVRDHAGVILQVSAAFVRVFGEPSGYSARDLVGARLTDLGRLDPRLVRRLTKLDDAARTRGSASAYKVPVGGDRTATVIKVVAEQIDGNPAYIGIASIEDGTEEHAALTGDSNG